MMIDNDNLTIGLVVSCVGFVSMVIYYQMKNVYSYWEKRNIPGPKPWPIFGHMFHILFFDRLKLEKRWVREHGKVYGIYFGTKPRLVVADPELMLQICIKDFDAVPNRETSEFANEYQKRDLINLQGDHWKRVRALMSPTFSSGKIKRMFRFLDACADDLVSCYMEQERVSDNEKVAIVNVGDVYSLFTMDAITTCCYGLKLERSGSNNLKDASSRNQLVKICLNLFEVDYWRLICVFCLPKFLLKFFGFKIIDSDRWKPIISMVNQMVDKRRESSKTKKFDDYLQLLVDAKLEDQMELDELDLAENHHAGLTNESLIKDQQKMVSEVSEKLKDSETKDSKDIIRKERTLDDIEIIANALFLLVVGLETTGTLLTNTTYILAFHQEIQQRLYEELKSICRVDYSPEKGKTYHFEYDTLTSCKYLDAVISETLRILSPIIGIDRVAVRDYFIEKYNLKLPKDSILFLCYYAIMNDPENFPNPDKYDPDRFMPGQKELIKPGTYCPFGLGPRHCLGMRFSLTEAKLALAKCVMNFRFEPAPNTTYPPEPMIRYLLNGIKNPSVRLISRS